MPNWESYLKINTLEWLLEDNNPSVKYFTLTDLMDEKYDTPEVEATRSKIMTEGPVPIILSRQKPEGYWAGPYNCYDPKFEATSWTLIILAELAADGNDRRIKQACEYIIMHSQHRDSGAFSVNGSISEGGNRNVIPCLTGNMIFSLIRCGYLEDPRIQNGIDWFVKYQRFDDGEQQPPEEWPYSEGWPFYEDWPYHPSANWPYNIPIGEGCWGKHTCYAGVAGCLKALSEIPEKLRSDRVRNTIKSASEYMLKHHIYKRSHNLNQIIKSELIKTGFPITFDFLGVLLILSKLGNKDNRMQDAVNLLLSKQNENGRWLLEESLNGKMQTDIEYEGKESKWITLNALRSLKYLYE